MKEQEVKDKLNSLLQKYERITNSGEIDKYNEEMTKKDFILPLFDILGWDTSNVYEDEVTAEESISRKRVDYAFRVHQIPKFFVEAKGINENINDRKYIDQAINYAWLKGVTWAVLTNFKQIKVFNAELKVTMPAAVQFFEVNCEEYPNSDQLLLLSKESITTGKLDEKAEYWGKKIPKKAVDDRLFTDLTNARNLLIKSINKFNDDLKLTPIQIEESVQRIISRLIFIRTLEDRGLTTPILSPIIRDTDAKTTVMGRLNVQFRDLDSIYNAKLFEKHLCEDLEIGNSTLTNIFENLYESEEQIQKYDFSVLDSDILGGIYEYYLSLITKNSGKENQHRKEGGIYYTPKYVVEYILQKIFEELEKNNVNLENIRILDPSCGSGSFLIKSFDYLAPLVSKVSKNIKERVHLEDIPYDYRTKVIENNLFGVDLDPMAVEIAHLNLFMKGLEKGKKLPMVRQNILNGNSLINDPKIEKKSFDWSNSFPEIMNDGKFDIIVGNPPYIRNRELQREHKEYLSKNYQTAEGQYDIYQLFFEKAISLLKDGGFLGFITSNKYAITSYGKKLREYILNTCKILSIVDVSNIRVFKDAATYPFIIILQKEPDENKRNNNKINISKVEKPEEIFKKNSDSILQKEFLENKDFVFSLGTDKALSEIISKIEKDSIPLGKFTIKETVHTGNIRDKLLLDENKGGNCKKILRGKDCQRYYYQWNDLWLDTNYQIDKSKKEYATIPEEKFFNMPKIFLREIAENITACYDEDNHYSLNKAYVINITDKDYYTKYVLALLNSQLLSWYFRSKFESAHVRGGYLQFKKQYTSEIPIKKIPKSEQEVFVELIDKMHDTMDEYKKLGNKNTDRKKELESKINEIDKEIEENVLKIYNITEDEKKKILA